MDTRLRTALVVLAATITGAAVTARAEPTLRYNYDYVCTRGLRIVVGHCRHDSDMPGVAPTTPENDYCQVYYPDRGSDAKEMVLRGPLIETLQVCGALGATTSGANAKQNTAPAASPPAAAPSATATPASSGLATSFPVTAQSTNPRWISEMPAPERILREIKGKDAEDTAERQMGAFKHLMEIIDSMAYGLEHRSLQMPNKATPDEIRIKDLYWKAYADVWHKARNKNDIYIHDGDLHDEMMQKFFSKGFQELLLKSDNNRSAIYDKHRKESEGVVLTVGPKDQPAPESVEDLLRKGLKTLSNSLTHEPVTPGLSLRGYYKMPNFYANFWSDRFVQVGCSGVNRNSTYTLERKAGQILIHIENDDDTVTLAFRPSLELVGPGALAIHGFVPGGSTTTTTPGEARQVTTTTQVQMNRTDVMSAGQQQNATQTGAQTYTVPQTTTSTEYTPPTTTTAPAPYIPKTVRCMAGTITPEPAAKPSNAPKEESTGLIGIVADALGGEAVFVPNGLRMAGTYHGQGGANIEFLDHKAIVGCHVTRDENPYTVAFRNGEVLVNVEGAGAPLAFKLNLDGTLVGNGATIPIYGQKIVGKNQQGDPVYASSSDTCAYGPLSPHG